jgi:hypothetical protein
VLVKSWLKRRARCIGVALGERTLIVKIDEAKIEAKSGTNSGNCSGSGLHENRFEHPSLLSVPSRILFLLSMVELRQDNDYQEIREDIQEECFKFGRVMNLLITRPDPSGALLAGVGKTLVEFSFN